MIRLLRNIGVLLLIILIKNPLHGQDNINIHKNALKTVFLSFFTGSAKLTYERLVFSNQSAELTAGIIGIGFDGFNVNPKGYLLRAAYKFILLQPFDAALSGMYIKPEYALSSFDYDTGQPGIRSHSTMQTILFCIGYQQTIKRLVLDGYVGAGTGWGDKVSFQYHHGFIERYGWLTLTFSIKVGFCF